jgi:hypothetical protein
MKHTLRLIHFSSIWPIGILTVGWILFPSNLSATEQNQTEQSSPGGERLFASPDEAVRALRVAAQSNDNSALRQIFGPGYDQVLTGDKAQDEKNAQHFAAAIERACKTVPEGGDKITLEIGTNDWPMPIPLVKANGQWYFDTAAGKEEIIARHIGKDELRAIGICRAYVKAQQKYSKMDAGQDGSYALKFKSSPGMRDGLYWPHVENSPDSPFSPSEAEGQTDRFVNNTTAGPQTSHGYLFRILTRQGPSAPGGKKDYMSQDLLAGGFALVAYPEHWGQSGIMTFIVNQDGQVYERNLGEKTPRIARRMKEYNPDGNWVRVQDEGILTAVTQQ